MSQKFADLHLHTTFSDGTYSPAELIRQSRLKGFEAVAITDHDTVNGIEEAADTGITLGVEVLAGIELTVEYQGLEVHILGYLIDYTNKTLLEKLKFLQKNRVERIYKIADKLKELGINLNINSVFNIVQQGVPGRLHIAQALVKEGFVSSNAEAFKKYLGDRSPAYVAGFKLSPEEGIKLIKSAGGIPVLAHPYVLGNNEFIPELIKLGLAGLEVYYPEHTQSMINFYLDLAGKFNLLVTGGSDCHGDAKPEVKLGLVKIPYELVEKLKEAK